jgi:hypothetical protein
VKVLVEGAVDFGRVVPVKFVKRLGCSDGCGFGTSFEVFSVVLASIDNIQLLDDQWRSKLGFRCVVRTR